MSDQFGLCRFQIYQSQRSFMKNSVSSRMGFYSETGLKLVDLNTVLAQFGSVSVTETIQPFLALLGLVQFDFNFFDLAQLISDSVQSGSV